MPSTDPRSRDPLDASQVAAMLDLHPLKVEGGLFRRTWASPQLANSSADRPAGTAIYALFSDEPDSFSAIHRLDADEVWHFYAGDPLEVHLFDAEHHSVILGDDLVSGHRPQLVIAAGTWMGAHVIDAGRWSLVGCTMAPGFVGTGYEGGQRDALTKRYPNARTIIERLTRPGHELGTPNET